MVIRIQSPVALEDCWEFAGGRSTVRKHMILMHQTGETALISDESGALAVAFIVPDSSGRREFCLAISSRARARMRELCRSAHLILTRMADHGPIVCYIVPGNRPGERMARIVGFRPDPDHHYRWIMEPADDSSQRTIRE